MKKYNLIPQEKINYCFCSVVQSIFDSHDIKISQDKIASQLNSSEYGFNIHDSLAKKFFINNGFDYKYYWRNQVLFNEIEFALDEMKEFDSFITINNHVYLFIEYNCPEVYLIDPKDSKIKKYFDEKLDREMKNSNIMGFFGLLKKL